MEASQDAQAVLAAAAVRLPLIELRPERLRLRWLVPLGGVLANLVLSLLLQPLVPAWLLAILTGTLVLAMVGWVVILYRYYPEASFTRLGTVVCRSHEIEVLRPGQETQRLALSPTMPPLLLHYEGYASERLDRYKAASGYQNFLTLPGRPALRLWVADRHTAEALRQVLRRWYELRLPIQESRQGNRTVLLALELSYEQIRAYKQEFGIRLYS